MKNTINSILLVIIILSEVLTLSCSEDYIKFDSLGIDHSHYNTYEPIIYVVSEKTPPPSLLANQQYWEQTINSTDYSKFFIIFVFHGPATSDSAFRVVSVQNVDGEILITAPFFRKYQGSITGEIISPAEGIRINKSNIRSSGQLKIKLLDTNGKERVSTITEIQ